jgi:acyl dehydratase
VVGSGDGELFSHVGTFDPAMAVHGEQGVVLSGPLPVDGEVRVTTTIVGMYDKGSGAVVALESQAVDPTNDETLFRTTSSTFIRGEGGYGGDRGPSGTSASIPQRDPDHVVVYPTSRDQTLVYRLSGDRNPLHSDPKVAAGAGFERPILHGLCTYGFTGRALLHALCGSDPARFVSMHGRFSRSAYPGDVLSVSMWVDGGSALFRTTTQRDEVVIDAGRFRFRLA